MKNIIVDHLSQDDTPRKRPLLTRVGISILAFLNPTAARYIREMY